MLELLRRSLFCLCPRCGRGKLYKSFLGFQENCPDCGLALARNDNGDGPAVFLIFILGFSLVPLAVIVALQVHWPLWVHGMIWAVLILGATLGLLRPAKALTLALQYRHRPEVFDS